jgi:hypothetical protein
VESRRHLLLYWQYYQQMPGRTAGAIDTADVRFR